MQHNLITETKMKRPLKTSASLKGLDDEHDASLIPVVSSVEEAVKHEEKPKPFLLNEKDEAEEDVDDEDLSLQHGQSTVGEKKRRLSVNQVKALEKTFEVENKLDPDKKVRLAQDLGLQPRQVAVWFQNRRARSKTKELERDYGALKARYDSLKVDCDSLRRDNEALVSEIKELKAKLGNTSSVSSLLMENTTMEEENPALLYRDGSSDSDSSAVFNDGASPYSKAMLDQHCTLVDFKAHCSPFLFDNLNNNSQDDEKYLDEELLSGEELCSGLFSEEQPTGLSWYCSMQGWD